MFGRRLWGRWLAVLVGASVTVLAGCGDFFSKNTGGGGGNTVGSYTYVGTQAGFLASYSVSSTGALAALSGSPLNLSSAAINALAITPNNGALYAAVAGTGVFGLSVNTGNGVPTLISKSPLASDVAPIAMTIDPSGQWVLVAGLASGAPAVGEYTINSDGTLAEVTGSPVNITLPSGADASNTLIQSIAIAPNSSYVFVSLGQWGIAAMPFSTSGSLTTNSRVITPRTTSGIANQDLGLLVSAGSTFLYAGETNAGVRVFSIGANNVFTEISGSPFAAGNQPRALAFDGTGGFLYVANASDSTISGYTVLASGVLTQLSGSPFSSVGSQPNALATDQSKKFLIEANLGGSPDVQLFSFDTTTAGKLDPGATVTGLTSTAVVASTH